MAYDLLNNNVRVLGKNRIINFDILSETYEGRRYLNLIGEDELGNQYTAVGWFDRQDYRLKVRDLQLSGDYFITEDGKLFVTQDGLDFMKPETAFYLLNENGIPILSELSVPIMPEMATINT